MAVRAPSGQNDPMAGPIIILVILLVAIPVGVLVSGGVFAGVLGWFAAKDAEERNEGTEWVELGGSGIKEPAA